MQRGTSHRAESLARLAAAQRGRYQRMKAQYRGEGFMTGVAVILARLDDLEMRDAADAVRRHVHECREAGLLDPSSRWFNTDGSIPCN